MKTTTIRSSHALQLREQPSRTFVAHRTPTLRVRAQSAADFTASFDNKESSSTCDWPRSCSLDAQRANIQINPVDRLQIALGLKKAPVALDADLPPDVEMVALFSDSPENSPTPAESWWQKIWRYQGP